uniref:Uncharacterized protein n=1 Tax=Romanomermis culicivorax TaxID=13658 RepID=A0A915JVQ0_ROMCU
MPTTMKLEMDHAKVNRAFIELLTCLLRVEQKKFKEEISMVLKVKIFQCIIPQNSIKETNENFLGQTKLSWHFSFYSSVPIQTQKEDIEQTMGKCLPSYTALPKHRRGIR